MQYAKISATSRYVPEREVDNFELSQMMETSDEWVTTRTGIKRRRISTQENTSDLCIRVANDLLAKSRTLASELDFLIVATMTPDYVCPSTACIVQGAIGATKALAFDLLAACSGFVYALSTAEKFIRSGGYQKGLVIGGEVLSKALDWRERATAVLFGDGAGGVLLECDNAPHLLAEKLQADGVRSKSLTSNFLPFDTPFLAEDTKNKKAEDQYLVMNGRAIFDFAVRDVPENIVATLARVGLKPSDVDCYLLHQANVRLLAKISKKLQVPEEKFLKNLENYGNTSAASIPILLAEAVAIGKLVLGSGKKVVFTGFGGGLTWGTLLFEL